MNVAVVLGSYFFWHYTLAFGELLILYRDFLWFIGRWFSFGVLLRTLFSPWRRLGEKYRGGFNLGAWAETLMINLLMRLVGLVFRLGLLFIGLILWLAAALLGLGFFLLWPLLPFLIFILGYFGFLLIL